MGIAVWGAIFVGRGADKVDALTAGTTAASGPPPRELVEAASSGSLDHALVSVPPHARETLADAAREGFLTGLNDVLTVAALIAFIGAALALARRTTTQFSGPDASFSLVRDERPLTEHVHLAFPAREDATVRAFHAAALAAGYEDHGAPGERSVYHSGYYGAFVLDPDGHNVEVVNHNRG